MKKRFILAVLLLGAWRAGAATPDIGGPWIIEHPDAALTTLSGAAPLLLAAAASIYAANRKALAGNPDADPAHRCLPPGVPRLMEQNFPFSILQGKTMVAMIFEWNHLTRLIHLTAAHSETIGPLYLGQSIGHWQDNVLVVDTNSFNDTTWLDDTGLPHSMSLHTVEKLSLAPGGQELFDDITIDDAQSFSHPWTARLSFRKAPGTPILEDYCLGRVGKAKLLKQDPQG